MITLVKYSNRKIYSKDTGKYVTLKDITEVVKDYQEVVVIEHSTGEDVTADVLAQALLKHNPLSVKQLISILTKNVVYKGQL